MLALKVSLVDSGATSGAAADAWVTPSAVKSTSALSADKAVPTKAGFTFDGYYDQPNGAGAQYITEDMEPTAALTSRTATATPTLYANWVQIVSFDANGGQGYQESLIATSGQNVTVPACSLTRPGYAFAGWSTVASGEGGTTYDPADSSANSFLFTGSTVLYARWTATQLTFNVPTEIEYNPDSSGNLTGPTDGTKKIVNGSSAGIAVTGIKTTGNGLLLVNDTPSAWQVRLSITPGAGTAISLADYAAAGYTVPSIASDWFIARSGNLDLNNLTGTLGGISSYTSDVDVGNVSWRLALRTVTVSYDAAGGTGPMSSQDVDADVSFAALACAFTPPDGMTFQGWATTSGGSVVYVPGAPMSFAADQILYAVWA